ncbi:MAG: transketolase [Planctomycetaceae bacterium]|nr:transketolase [Planctomycetaceae bacterium]
MSTVSQDVSQLTINTIRTLAMDGVQAANSGHPGTPMALAPVAYQIWTGALRYDPEAPLWPNRDRFVLSCGHASMLIYSVLHLAGVKKLDDAGNATDELAVTLEDLKNFRQWGSATPGHPEYGHTYGVETTTGPLGQGCGNSVGMAIASKWLAANYNQPGFELFDYNVYTLCSDGDLMEGVCCEAASLAGHLKLANLCWLYDDNKITIEGDTDLAFSEDVATRFEGLGWNVLRVDDANDLGALASALDGFHKCDDAPTLIIVRSVIGYGAPNKAGSHSAHGEPLGADEIKATKAGYGWPEDAQFLVPDEAPQNFADTLGVRGREQREAWEALFAKYAQQHPQLAEQIKQMQAHELPAGWDADLPEFPADAKGVATRATGGKALNAVAKNIPWLIGGSADLAPSTKTLLAWGEAGDFGPDNYAGRNFHFGIREHAMAAAVNGMCLSGVRAYGATFFVFSDYCRPSLRLAAIMGVPAIHVFTHDSIGVGEDGPTHQPVEQLAAARSIPNMVVLRPGDANETSQAWRAALLQTKRPALLVLTRQNLPTLDRSKYASADGVLRGGYVLADAAGGKPEVILMGTGSELSLAVAAYEQLTAEGVAARVVSLPSMELFADQDAAYRESVLPPGVKARVAVEAGVRQGWDRYIGDRGEFVGMHGFGASAPQDKVFQEMGITVDAVVDAAKRSLGA